MAAPQISSIRYKDISHDKADVAVTKLKTPCGTYSQPVRRNGLRVQEPVSVFVGTDNETLSVTHARQQRRFFARGNRSRQDRLLKKAEQFENDYNNDNYSDYVEDASVHVVD